METDRDYFVRRAGEERHASAVATNDEARRVHAEMARRYEDLADALQSRSPVAA